MQVCVIKCLENEKTRKILESAEESYRKIENGIYYVGEKDEERLMRGKIESNALIAFFIFDETSTKHGDNSGIKELLIGEYVDLKDEAGGKKELVYRMYCHLQREKSKSAMLCILDKIDFDFWQDFEQKHYVKIYQLHSLYEELQQRILAAKRKCDSTNVKRLEQEIRNDNDYRRDCERIVRSKAFRRMVDKAQIFSSDRGDHYRTRMTHTLEVNQIAKMIAAKFDLDPNLTEAIALGHDVGHTPFGHQGERTLDDILSGKIECGLNVDREHFKNNCFGRFKHNYQSLRVLTKLERISAEDIGLGLSIDTLDGILKHTKVKEYLEIKDFLSEPYQAYSKEFGVEDEDGMVTCLSLEGQVVALADEIAQRGHDIDDALTSGAMTLKEFHDCLDIDLCEALKAEIKIGLEVNECLISDIQDVEVYHIVKRVTDYFINATFHNEEEDKISLHEDAERVMNYLENVVQKRVICNQQVATADYNAEKVISGLFMKYYEEPRLMPQKYLKNLFFEMLQNDDADVRESAIDLTNCRADIARDEIDEIKRNVYGKDGEQEVVDDYIFEKRRILIRTIIDYIAGMTDGFALSEYQRLF